MGVFSGTDSCEHLQNLSSVNMRVSRPSLVSSLLLLLITLKAAHADSGERSVLEAELNDDAENEIEETQTIESNETVEVIANEPSDKIKEENIDKCDKCLKSTFRYRHDGFCGKCVSNNIIDVNEQQEINDAMRCKKCKKPKFRSRHLLFCTDNCHEEIPTTTTSTSTSTVASTTQETTTAAAKIKSNSNNVKEDKIRFQNRENKQRRRDQKRKEKQQRKLLKKQKKKNGETETDYSEAVRLGPLGNVLKYLIVANTWKGE